ncbi:MAG: hypothetical protein V4681_02405 [Patescibacteria group bacterium]
MSLAESPETGTSWSNIRTDKIQEFCVLLQSPQLREAVKEDESFTAFIALAVNVYGVLRASLSSLLEGATPDLIKDWTESKRLPPVYCREPILDRVFLLLAATAIAQETTDAPVKITPLPHPLRST